MWLRIESADFDAMRLILEIDPGQTTSFMSRFDRFIVLCKSEAYRQIDVCYADGATVAPEIRNDLEELSRRRMLTLHPPGERVDTSAGHSGARFRCTNPSSGVATESDVGYQLTITHFERGADFILSAVQLICTSLEIEDVAAGNVRLSIYELVANCIEHGVFDAANPTIVVDILFRDRDAEVTYLDNATPFIPSSPLINLVEEQAKAGSRRGLGLFIIHRLASDIMSTRVEEWNSTKFRIALVESPAGRR